MKLFFSLLLILSFQAGKAQNEASKKYLKILSAGFCEDDSKKCIDKQISYLNACDWLGHYNIQLKKYQLAFKYYSLPGKLNGHNTNFQSEAAINIRSNVIVKAGDMILKGQGMKKDTSEAFFYHNLLPYPLSEKLRVKYSNLYFNSGNDTAIVSMKSNANEMIKIIAINPFFLIDTATISKLKKEVSNIEPLLLSDSSLKCTLEMFYGNLPISEEGQGTMWLFLNEASKELMTSHAKRTETNLEIDSIWPNQIIKRGISFPLFKITVAH
jgi:hypothetical protein